MVKLLFSVMCILMSVSGFAQEQIKIKHGPLSPEPKGNGSDNSLAFG